MRALFACALVALASAGAVATDWQRVDLTESRILDFDLEGNVVWASVNGSGLVRYDGTQIVFDTASSDISQDSWAYTVFVDSDGGKWPGRDASNTVDRLDDAGTPSIFSDDEWLALTYPADFINKRVFSMTEGPDGAFWFGMRDESHNQEGTLELYLSNADTVLHFDNALEPFQTQFADDDVRALAVDDSGRLWIGYFSAGIDIWDVGDPLTFDDDEWTHYGLGTGLPSNRIFELHATADGQILAGTQAGLALFDGPGDVPTVVSDFPGTEVRSIATDARGYIWIGTDDGVAMLYQNGTMVRSFGTSDGLTSPTVERIAVDGATGTVWALTVGESIADTDLHWYRSDISVPGRAMPVFPNPWRADGSRREVTILGVTRGSKIDIYDVTGQRVRTLEMREEPYTWDTLDDDDNEVPSGLYVVRVRQPNGATELARVAIIR